MLLSEGVEAYIVRKQLMGRKYETCAKELRAFARLYPALQLSAVRACHVLSFLNGRQLRRETWICSYKRLRTFFSYWISRRQLSILPLPPARRSGPRTFNAHIFTPFQIRDLLTRAPEVQLRRFSEIAPETFRTLVIFIYATGCWISEALALQWSDIDFKRSVIAIDVRVGAQREIPIGTDLKRILQRQQELSRSKFVFPRVGGGPIMRHRATVHFRRVRKLVGIRGLGNSAHEPGFRDLRHTFAVTRISDWYRKGADIELMLPRLAHYMGLFTCTITERYLPLVPEHFREQLDKIEVK